MRNINKIVQILLFGTIFLVEESISAAKDEKPISDVLRSSPYRGKKLDSPEKDEKLNTASQSLFGYNGFNNNNGFGGGVNNGIYPQQGAYNGVNGLYNGADYNGNQNGFTTSSYPLGAAGGFNNNNQLNGFGYQGGGQQGFYAGGNGFQNQAYLGGFNSPLVGGGGGRFPVNNFGMPYNTQGLVGVGTYQAAGYNGAGGGLYQQGGQISDRRSNQYIGNGRVVGNRVDVVDVGGGGGVAGGGRSPFVSPAAGRTTNQPGFVAGQGQGFGLNYADQPYNILPGGVYNAQNGYPSGGIQGGIYRQNNIYNQPFDYFNGPYNRFANGGNRFNQGTDPQGIYNQRVHRFVSRDTDRN